MTVLKNLFHPDYDRYEGVRKYKIYLMRLVFGLTFIFVGLDSWTTIISKTTPWDHVKAVAFCTWASYSLLCFIGLLHPLKMLSLMLFMILYKVIWLFIVAYPLWVNNMLSGSPAEEMAYTFTWVLLPIVAVPWKYVFRNYITNNK